MYFMTGSDGREYGPVDLVTLTQWAKEGRLNPSTPIRSEESAEPKAASEFPELAMAIAPPPTAVAPPAGYAAYTHQPPAQSGGMNKMIPTSNPDSLWAYYLSIGGLCFWPLGPIAIYRGIKGWKKYKDNPEIHGNVHSWVGIILGSIDTLLLLLMGFLILAAITSPPT